jgi:hypothetical protein
VPSVVKNFFSVPPRLAVIMLSGKTRNARISMKEDTKKKGNLLFD